MREGGREGVRERGREGGREALVFVTSMILLQRTCIPVVTIFPPSLPSTDTSYLAQELSLPPGSYDPAIEIDQQTDSNHDTALTLAAAGTCTVHVHTSTCI